MAIIPFLKPEIPESERFMESVREITNSGMFVFGKYTKLFEEKIAKLCGVKHAIAVSNCSSGLIMIMTQAGSNKVIMPAFTFSATWQGVYWNSLLQYGFSDVDSVGCMTPELLKPVLIQHPGASVLAVHMYGNPCDADGLQAVVDEYGGRLFFDSAHALGSTINGVHVGGNGLAEVFSIGATKCLPCGEGGIITTDNDELAAKLIRARIHGKVDLVNHYESPLDINIPGLNARPQEFSMALGYHLLDYLPKFIARRNEIADYYANAFGLHSVTVVKEGNTCSYKDFAVQVGHSREDKLAAMQVLLDDFGIQTKEYYYPILPCLQAVQIECTRNITSTSRYPTATVLADTSMAIPIYPAMTDSQVEYVADKVKQCL